MEKSAHSVNDTGWLFSNVFNLYDAFLLMIGGIALLLIIPLLLKRDRQQSDLLLSAFIFSQGALAILTVSMYNKFVGPLFTSALAPYHFLPSLILILSQGFLLYAYVTTMTGKTYRLKTRTNGIWLGLVVLALTIDLVSRAAGLPQMKPLMPLICMVTIPSIIMGVKGLRMLWHFDITIRDYFSNIDKIKLAWLRLYATGFVVVWCTTAISTLIIFAGYPDFALTVTTFANLPPLLLMSGMVIHGQVLPLNIQKFASDEESKNADEKQSETFEKHKATLEDLMVRVKIYQDPELRLDGLADCMNISPRTVSTLLNNHYQQSFYDFVNQYRVRDAQEQLLNPKNHDKPVQRIFEDAGFNSKSTFNTLFKKLTGKTPSEFRVQAKASTKTQLRNKSPAAELEQA